LARGRGGIEGAPLARPARGVTGRSAASGAGDETRATPRTREEGTGCSRIRAASPARADPADRPARAEDTAARARDGIGHAHVEQRRACSRAGAARLGATERRKDGGRRRGRRRGGRRRAPAGVAGVAAAGNGPHARVAAVQCDAARGSPLERAGGLAGAWCPAARDVAGLAAGRFGGAAPDDPGAALVDERGGGLVRGAAHVVAVGRGARAVAHPRDRGTGVRDIAPIGFDARIAGGEAEPCTHEERKERQRYPNHDVHGALPPAVRADVLRARTTAWNRPSTIVVGAATVTPRGSTGATRRWDGRRLPGRVSTTRRCVRVSPRP